MRTSLITLMGTSPPVATELLQYLLEGEKVNITDFVLVTTSQNLVQVSSSVVKAAISVNYPRIRVYEKKFGYEDIDSYEANIEFLKFIAGIMKDEMKRHGVKRMYVNLAGGRKDMVLDTFLVSQFYPVEAVYHVVMPQVSIVNPELERARKEMENLHLSKDPKAYYIEHRELLDKVMFPHPSSYSVIRIPFIPFPDFVLARLGLLRRDKGLSLKRLGLPQDYVQRLRAQGVITIGTQGAYLTELGETLLNVLL